jgi:lysozyme family protein
MRYGTKWPEYARQWDAMRINPARLNEFVRLAQFAIEHKARYAAIQEMTARDGLGREGEGVPWWMIAALHRRESDADFTTYLGNGEPLNRKTKLVPKGRGPFASFEAGALDAFKVDGLSAVLDWRLEKVLYFWELFNGPGYHVRGLPSPYLWGGTNIQKPGKFVADGKWNGRAVDKQPGCAPLLAAIAKLDPSIQLVRES